VGRVTATNVTGRPADTCALLAGRTAGFRRASSGERIFQGVLAAGLAGALVLGGLLTPSPTGSGTHEALGLPPCGMLLATGHPCPTCGATTAYVLACHGRLIDALATQPFGLLVFLGVAGGLALNVVTAATGRSWLGWLTPGRVSLLLTFLALAGLISWGYKWSIT
jgi:hypothetical protein